MLPTPLPTRTARAMAALRAHLEAGEITPVVDLDAADEAIRYLAQGEPVGRVVLSV